MNRLLEYEYRLNGIDDLASTAILCLYDAGTLPAWLGGELKKVHPLIHANGTVSVNGAFVADPAHAAAVPLVEDLEPPADRLPCSRLAELLSAYVDGELAPQRREQVARRLGTCAECARRLASYRAARSALESLRTPSDVDPGFWAAVRKRLADPPDLSA